MRHYYDVVLNQAGVGVSGASVTVYQTGTLTKAALFSDDGVTAKVNPVTTDGQGRFDFYVADGRYDVTVSGSLIGTFTQTNIEIADLSEVKAGDVSWQTQTLEFANQTSGATPPAGLLNLYSKIADKRLYYKDDTGTEVGPLSFSGASLTSPITNPNPIAFDVDVRYKGPNPYADVTRYGARSVTTVPTATATTTSGSPTVSLSVASTFINGDGITIYGAGAAHTMTTPGIPTVTPSVSSGMTGTGFVANGTVGATTYNYKIIARRKAGGLTAASTAGSTTTGAAALGSQSVSISTLTRSNTTVTVTTATPHGLTVGSMVYISGVSDAGNFSGWFQVGTVADSTHFTYGAGLDSRNGATTSGTGGTVTWFNCNHLTWTAVTGAWEYYIYSDRAASGTFALIGVSKPQGTTVDLTFDDFGSPMMDGVLLPAYVPLTAPASAANDNLTTTIVSGAGTTTLTLAANAGASVTATAVQDSVPGILAAATATANNRGTLYFPATPNSNDFYYVGSYLALPNMIAVNQAGSLALDDTMEFGFSDAWYGDRTPQGRGATSFAARGNVIINVSRANPGLYFGQNSTFISGVDITATTHTNNVLQAFYDQTQANVIRDVNFITSSSNTDYMGMALLMRGIVSNTVFDNYLENVTFGGGPSQVNGSSATPLFFCNFCGETHIHHSHLNRRGILFQPGQGGTSFSLSDTREQGGITPVVTIIQSAAGFTGGSYHLRDVEEDTMAHGLLAVFGQLNGLVVIDGTNGGSLESGGQPGVLSGSSAMPTLFLNPWGTVTSYGQNINMEADQGGSAIDGVLAATATPGSYSLRRFNKGFNLGNTYSLFASAAPITDLSCTVAAGGSVPVGTHTYQVAPFWQNGAQGDYSNSFSLTTTPGNQTVNCTWTGAAGGPKGYIVFRDGSLGPGTCTLPTTTATSFADTFGFTCGTSGATLSAGGPTVLNATGLIAPQLFLAPVTFANLGTPADGTLKACSNCTVASPCAGGGTGALAKRFNGTWVCN